jgi:site-specific DNA-methyltransferase (adenine-specific)
VTYEDSFGVPGDYVAYMRPRITALQRALCASGSLFFHCDWRMSHHVRLLLDEVFCVDEGRGVFVNEIIWHYGLGAARAGRRLLSKHDVIFWYANSDKYTFNLMRAAPTQAMQAKYRHVDEQGNHYMNSYGKRYLLKGGKPLDDVWDIPTISPTSSERTGYPTQKPLALLNRIVQLATNPGDLVLDPFCGSGTTLAAAQMLGRAWIGIDANPQAIEVAGKRLGNRD